MNIKTQVNSCGGKFINFASKTSLHGFSYIVNRNLSLISHILWTIVICSQLYACYYFTLLTIERRNKHPILLAYDTRPTSIANVSLYC